jgi:hypothetical protein
MSNATNSVTALQALQTLINDVEAGNLFTGVSEIDQETRAILGTNIGSFLLAVIDLGSRAQQKATATSRAAANNGIAQAQEGVFLQLDQFMTRISTQINVLQNPASVPRRVQTTLR